MRVTTSKSKNAESFYISKGYINDKGVSTSVIVRKLGTLKELLPEHGPTRDDVMAWANLFSFYVFFIVFRDFCICAVF